MCFYCLRIPCRQTYESMCKKIERETKVKMKVVWSNNGEGSW